ncbi:MAG: sigma-70 family RNA polymerase sigma factor [Rhodothermia bacterium]|nr:sigma-70 family RNA polymerase sigma factor [Rhodothermia bacterium]
MGQDTDITALLLDCAGGDQKALDRIFPHVYEHLKDLAHARLRGERGDHTLNTTGLVHEAYLKLAGANQIDWTDRDHFYAVASRLMRRVLVNYALARNALKRGGKGQPIPLDEDRVGESEALDRIIDLDHALQELEKTDIRAADVVQHHYFGGFTVGEIAEILHISSRTVERDLRFARAWLARALK